MADEWREVTVGEIAAPVRNALVGGPFGSDLVSADYVAEGVPVIRGQNMGGRWVGGDFVYVTDAKADRLNGNLARPGDIVFTQRGTLGQVSLVPAGRFDRYLVSQSQMKLTVNDEIADPTFCYYQFCSEDQQNYIRLNAIQTGVPHTNLGILRSTPFLVPPLAEQRAIAQFLGTLDDKIELNHRRNETLGAMARALFQDWFVDFGPARAKMEGREPYLPADLWQLFPGEFDDSGRPEGWEERPLDKIADFLNGLALQKFPATDREGSLPVIKIAELRNGISAKTDRASRDVPAKYLVNDGDFLFSWSGSLMAKFWTEGEGALNQHLFKVTSEHYPIWFVSQWVHHHLEEFQAIAASKATTMGHIQRGHLKSAMTMCPPDDELAQMSRVMGPLVEQCIQTELESRSMAQLRDTLLPKLISGELRIKDAEHFISRAGI
ncbi:MAG: restriction endonuclease subunit S [Dyella sp.]|uniref:restriction endonuclease subunit S n=1 Tax=Dyella sp. TaxID=1869338 RepID=UPI003F8155F2